MTSRSKAFIALTVLAIGSIAALLLYEISVGRISDGAFSFTVYIASPGGMPRSIRAEPYGHISTAERVAQALREDKDVRDAFWRLDVTDYDGRPLPLRVHNWDHQSRNGWFEYDYGYERSLLIDATFSDGERIIKVVEIPDGMVTKQMTVTFP
jgi:hypothetical protein